MCTIGQDVCFRGYWCRWRVITGALSPIEVMYSMSWARLRVMMNGDDDDVLDDNK